MPAGSSQSLPHRFSSQLSLFVQLISPSGITGILAEVRFIMHAHVSEGDKVKNH